MVTLYSEFQYIQCIQYLPPRIKLLIVLQFWDSLIPAVPGLCHSIYLVYVWCMFGVHVRAVLVTEDQRSCIELFNIT